MQSVTQKQWPSQTKASLYLTGNITYPLSHGGPLQLCVSFYGYNSFSSISSRLHTKTYVETCGWNMLKSAAFTVENIHNLSWVIIFFYPWTFYLYDNSKSCRFFLHHEASIRGELTKFCICSELCNLVVLQEKRRGQFCTCKSNYIQWCCSLASHTLTSIPSPSWSFSTWAQRSFILTLDC